MRETLSAEFLEVDESIERLKQSIFERKSPSFDEQEKFMIESIFKRAQELKQIMHFTMRRRDAKPSVKDS